MKAVRPLRADAAPPRDQPLHSTTPAGGRAAVRKRSVPATTRNAKFDAGRLAQGLGWFSLAVGIAELLAPRAVARLAGASGQHTALVRLYGLREIASGLLIFNSARKSPAGLWSRVGGDAIDLITLGAVAALPTSNKAAVALAAANVLGVTALDVLCAQELSRQTGALTDDGAVRVAQSIAINRTPQQVYEFWRNVQNLPRFMYHVESVDETAPGESHWVTKAFGGRHIEWDSRITADEPGRLLAWRSLDGSDVDHSGSVEFEARPGGRGTIVRVVFEYSPPGGVIGAAWAKLVGDSPARKIDDDLRRLKQVIETGEVVRSDGSPEGTGRLTQRPAQPA